MIRIDRLDGTADLSIPFRIRKKVFMEEQNVPEAEEYDGFDEESVHYILYYQDVPCATARWRHTEEGIKLERFSVLPEYRGRGIGGRLVEVCVRDIRSMFPFARIYLHAQVDVIQLYAKYGFRETGEKFTECDIPHQAMELSAGNTT